MTVTTFESGSDPAGGLVAWAAAGDAAYQLARRLTATAIVPDQYRNKPDEAAAAIMLGAELGLSPIAALRSMFVIRGQVGMYVRAQLALVQSRGHRVWTEHESDDSVTVAGYRAGDPEHVEHVTWTIARAQRAGFIRRGRNNEPSQYDLQPRAMLWARAVGELCRRIAADVLAGVPEGDEPVVGDEPSEPRTRIVQRLPKAQSAPPDAAGVVEDGGASVERIVPPDEPNGVEGFPESPARVVDVELPDDAPLDDVEPSITEPQRALIMVELSARGITGHAARVMRLAQIIGRKVESTNDLTVTEASHVIDTLQLESARAEPVER